MYKRFIFLSTQKTDYSNKIPHIIAHSVKELEAPKLIIFLLIRNRKQIMNISRIV